MSSSSPSLSKPPRRVPPPCWTPDETLALIESYHHKWYSLGRGNLKASHWQQVADSVAARCPLSTPPKTSTQCRHKIEKLRKRYRTEKQRASASSQPNRFFSSWNFFKKMDDLEKGPPSSFESDNNNSESDNNDDEDDDVEDDELTCRINSSPSNFRFRVPIASGSGSMRPPGNPRFTHPNSSPGPRLLTSSALLRPPQPQPQPQPPLGNGIKRELDPDPVAEMISSIRMLGEGYVKMEERKLEMEREMEQTRMEMEMKRTHMILESQQRIVEAFASGFSGNKKMKRMPPSPESEVKKQKF